MLRVLAGEWSLKTTRAEKETVCRRWLESGGSLNHLERLTGWRTSRYIKASDYRTAA